MIVRIKTKGKKNAAKGNAQDNDRRPLLPLRRTRTGTLVAISPQPDTPWANAIRRCIEDIVGQLDRLTANFSHGVEIAKTNLFELVTDAEPNDTIYIQGVKYVVDSEGAIVVSSEFAKPGEFDPGDIPIDEHVYQAVIDAMHIETTGVAAKLVILDVILNEPMVLLSKIAVSEPAILGDVAGYMVTVYGTRLDGQSDGSPRKGAS